MPLHGEDVLCASVGAIASALLLNDEYQAVYSGFFHRRQLMKFICLVKARGY